MNDSHRPADVAYSSPPDHAPLTLAVVGVGLIGGSFAAALRQACRVTRVLGVGRQPATLQKALDLGLIDAVVDAPTAAAQADLVMLAVPVGAMHDTLRRMAPFLQDHTVLTDAGSTKTTVVQAAREALGTRIGQFVPGHPIAGAESSGPEAARATLYQGKQVVLTPLPENSAQSLACVTQAWQACGAIVRCMTALEHDQVLGSVSHLPHLLSAVYMAQVATSSDAAIRLDMAGSGFRDFTRIAAGSPEMWRDIFLSNAQALRMELDSVRKLLDDVDGALARGDGAALESLLDVAAQARRTWPLPRKA